MEHTRASALAAFEIALHRFDAQQRDPGAWEERHLRDALTAIQSGDYNAAAVSVRIAKRAPTADEVSVIGTRQLLTRAEIRDRLDDLRTQRQVAPKRK